MIIITERNVEIFEIEAQNYAEWREEEEKNYFRLRVTLKFYQTGKMFSKFLTNILALEWEIIHLRCYSYSEIIVVKKCKFSSSCAALVREGLGPSSTFKMADAGKLKEL